MTRESVDGAVLITGASTGIGRSTALHLDHVGFRVFAGVRKAEDGEVLRRDASDRLSAVILDVTDQSSIDAARQLIDQRLGAAGLAGLINNAGTTCGGAIEVLSLPEVRKVFDVNVFGLLAVTAAFLPLVRRARGRIVNISSIANLVTLPFHGAYSASKRAVQGITDALRLEVRPLGVEVALAICGAVRTPIWQKGAASRERLRYTLSDEMRQVYGAAADRLAAYFAETANQAIEPERAAAELARAMTDRRPKKYYYIGPDARRIHRLSRLLSSRWGDAFVLRSIGLEAKRG